MALARASLLLGDRGGAETVLVEARGFLVRQPDAVRAIRQVDEVSELVAQMKHQAPGGSSSLTTAELRVLHYLPTNLTLAAIGSRLYISRYTVKTHCQAIYRKLDATSRAEAVDTARRLGLLTGRAGRTTDRSSPSGAAPGPPLERQGGRAGHEEHRDVGEQHDQRPPHRVVPAHARARRRRRPRPGSS